CSGGRYEDLASLYTTSRLPGVGISIGLTRLFWQLRELGMAGATANTVAVLVTLIDEEGFETALRLATELRTAGVNTEVSMRAGRLSQQLKYADRAQIPVVVIAGADERQRGTVQVRNLVTRVQQEVAASEVTATVSGLL
ncbi:MAG: His/Gly/Thr/Pro-type tRNA ligase C-terminal domain-containing protein, partial [Acidimicrobiia bacterium]